MNLRNDAVAALSAALLLALSLPAVVQSSPYVISDGRIRSLDITPVLGRGYSIMTNSFQSTCLMVEETTIPSYNYDYSFYDFSETTNVETKVSKTMSYSFNYGWFSSRVKKVSTTETTTSSTTEKTRYVAASMRIERYYSSVREEVTPLNADAITLIDRQDYVGFFKACGPTYVRGIRRAQEVAATFIFKSSSTESSQSFSRGISVSSWRRRSGSGSASQSTQNTERNSMTIIIKGFGLGLSLEGSESFVAESLEEYQKVMDFAFHTMTRASESHHIGMVYGMEVSPWVENTAFQVASALQDEIIEIPQLLSVIPRAFEITDPSNLEFDNTSDQTRAEFMCKEPSFQMDMYGFCCEEASLYDFEFEEYSAMNPSARTCRPMRQLDPTLMKDNMSANGEFVARMDRSVRYKFNQMSTLERCISEVRSIPERFDYMLLKNVDTVQYDDAIKIDLTVYELKMAIDPFNDYAMLKHMAKELDEYLDMFIQPCYAALFGTNSGLSPGTEASFFYAYPWYSHDACTKLECLGSSMRWDRSNPEGGCVPSLLAGPDSASFAGGDGNCLKDTETGFLQCKHDSNEMEIYHKRMVKTWGAVVPKGKTDYFVSQFCMPQLSGEFLEEEGVNVLKKKQQELDGISEASINVAKGKDAHQISTWPHYGSSSRASLAVDGNTDGDMWRASVTHTYANNSPWWYVNLGSEQEIKRIVIYRRRDCCHNRLAGMQVSVENSLIDAVVESRGVGEQDKMTINFERPYPRGDRVRVSLPGRQYLHLAEVEVWNHFLIQQPVSSGGITNFNFYPRQDSSGNDISREYGTLDELADLCFTNRDCKGFNTNGYLKHTLRPLSQWATWTTDSTKGFYVRSTIQVT